MLARERVVEAAGTPSPLPPGAPLKLPIDIDGDMAGQRSAARTAFHRTVQTAIDGEAAGNPSRRSVAVA